MSIQCREQLPQQRDFWLHLVYSISCLLFLYHAASSPALRPRLLAHRTNMRERCLHRARSEKLVKTRRPARSCLHAGQCRPTRRLCFPDTLTCPATRVFTGAYRSSPALHRARHEHRPCWHSLSFNNTNTALLISCPGLVDLLGYQRRRVYSELERR